MRSQFITALAVFATSAAALSTPQNYVSHEKRDSPLKRWVKMGEVHRDAVLPMRIGLAQPKIENGFGADLIDEVSHPDSPRYGQWYTPEEIHEIFAPSQDVVDSVKAWLVEAGIKAERISHSVNKQWLQVDAKVHEAERILRTKYNHYAHTATGHRHVACEEYFVPEHLAEHIDYVTPGIKLLGGGKASNGRHLDGRKRDMEKRGFRTNGKSKFGTPVFGPKVTAPLAQIAGANPLSMCDQIVTPECIMAMYNITKGTKAFPTNQLGIFEEGDFYAAEDLVEFFALFASYIPATTMPKLEGIDGGFAPSAYAGGESDLDFQISYPLIYPQNSILFQTDDIFYATGVEGGGGFLNTFLDALDGSYCKYKDPIDPVYPDPNPAGYQGNLQCGFYKPTNVISISYGEQEDDLPTRYQNRQCAEFLKLGLQGVSVVIASGDSGVAARSTDDNNSDGCLGKGEVFNPDFPASCPYITAAGATYLPPGADATKDQEVAVTRFPSGGGFSNIYPRPNYQNAAVNTYLTAHKPPYKTYSTYNMSNPPESVTNGGIYNIAGRGYPDISAVGDNIIIINNGAPTLIGGTSASAPVFASILNRINEERLARGKRSVGFVNPTLYKNPSAFHDITVGSNPGCNTNGFAVTPGWDPVTGLGTPNYPALLKVFLALP